MTERMGMEESVIEDIPNLEQLKAIDPETADKNDLVDIREVSVNGTLPREERMADYLKQIKNPYLCRCGNMVIQSVFADTDITLTERLQQYFTS